MDRSTLLGVTLVALSACGGVASLDSLFGAGGGGGAGGEASMDSTSAGPTAQSSTTSAATASAGGATTTATGGPSGTGPSGTGPSGTGPSTSSGGGPTSTSGSTVSTGAGGSDGTVFCGGQPCNAGDICCFNLTMPTDHCGQSGTCEAGYVELSCTGPEDCPGHVCCGDLDPQPNQAPYSGIHCSDTCDGDAHIVVCSDANPTCPAGTMCAQSSVLGPGYKVCKQL